MEKLEFKKLLSHSIANYENKLILFSDVRDISEFLTDDLMTDSIVLGLVTEGQLNICVDGEDYHLGRGDMFAFPPNIMLSKSMVSVDFQPLGFYVSADYGVHLADSAGLDWTMKVMMQNHELFQLDDGLIASFQHTFDLLRGIIQRPDSPSKGKAIEHIMLSSFFMLYDLRTPEADDFREQTFSPQENLLQRFTLMLKDSNPLNNPMGRYLCVNEYAERLHVTPKYFSTTCKRLTGRTAGQIINEEIITTAKLLLRDNSKSIKQISDLLGFSNQSHFGTYFSKRIGMPPQQFRGR